MSAQDHHPLQIVHRPSGDPTRTQQLGPYGIEGLVDRDEAGAGTVWRVRIEPHQRTAVSFHRVAEEYYFVLSGSGTAILDGQEYLLRAGDFLRLPPGVKHGFVTQDEAIDMLDVHTPGCWPDHDTYFADGPPPDGFAGPT